MTPRSPRTVQRTARHSALTMSAVLAVVGLAACGDDDADSVSTTTAVDTAPESSIGSNGTGGEAAALASVCDDYATITGGFLAGQADPASAPAVLDRFAEDAPEEISAAAATIRTGLTALFDGDETVFEDPDFTGALSEAGDHLFRVCPSAAQVEVSAGDYSFTGLPAEVTAGRIALRMINTSAAGEPHELILLRRPEGDVTPVADLAQLPMDEMMGAYEMAGVVFVDQPATANTAFVDLEPGSYVAICTIPVAGNATTSHAMAGMIADLEVSA